MASQPTEKERKQHNKACEKVTNALYWEDGYINELKILFNAYKWTKHIEFKPCYNKYKNFKNNIKRKSDYQSKYIVANSVQDTISHSILDLEMQQVQKIILDNDCNQPNSNDHEITNSHLDVTIE